VRRSVEQARTREVGEVLERVVRRIARYLGGGFFAAVGGAGDLPNNREIDAEVVVNQSVRMLAMVRQGTCG
jgi:hypothetical protein